MAQSALTVFPPSPTPPTNMACTGASPPNVPNYTKLSYAGMEADPPTNPPPYFDDGAAGPLHTFAANTAALASGTGATSGGTENSYPGTGNGSLGPHFIGAVPAASSVAHEGAGTEVTVLAPGNIVHTYVVGTLDTSRSASTGLTLPAPAVANPPNNPNATHASSMSPVTNPTLASITPTTAVSGAGTQLITCTGTGFVPGCRIWVDNVERTTTFVSATSLTTTVAKKPNAGPWNVDVKLAGVAVPSTRVFTWT